MSDTKPTIQLPLQTTAVLFDLDDTLHYRSKAVRGWAQWFARTHYREGDEAQIVALAEFMIEQDGHGHVSREHYFTQLRRAYPSLAVFDKPVEQLIVSYQREVLKHIVREEEIFSLLRMFKESHISFGIVTNGSASQQRRKIEILGLQELTSCIFISGAFGVRKPERTIFLAAAQCLKTPPERILFVGDHPRYDIQGAHEVGMRTVWIEHVGRGWPDEVAPDVADMRVGSLAELPGIFGVGASELV